MTMTTATAGRLIIVDGRGGAHRWKDALHDLRPEIVARFEEVGETSAEDVVIVDLPALGEDALASIRARIPEIHAKKLLAAAHEELPDILRTGVSGLFHRVVPRTGAPENVHAIVDTLRARGGRNATQHDVDGARGWTAVVELLRETVSEAARVPGVIIRSCRPRSGEPELQLVFRLDRGFERFHCELPRRWRWPLRAGERSSFTQIERSHPVVRSFGELARDQEIYLRPLANGASSAYLAILPWADDDRITVAIGLWFDDAAVAARAAAIGAIQDLHALAVREVMQFTLPTLDDTSHGVSYLLEYDWVIAEAYAGPDRRGEDTSLVNRYMVCGRRKALARSALPRAGGFVDGVPSWVGLYFAAYSVLATIDTVCTSRFVRSGLVTELNPLLAPLIGHHPWLFLLVKNALAVAAFSVVVRFHRFRRARHVLRASVAAYGLLDLYWAILLIGQSAR
jgi:hypothetical protein